MFTLTSLLYIPYKQYTFIYTFMSYIRYTLTYYTCTNILLTETQQYSTLVLHTAYNHILYNVV